MRYLDGNFSQENGQLVRALLAGKKMGEHARTGILKQLYKAQKRSFAADTAGQSWKWLKERGHDINPCRSK